MLLFILGNISVIKYAQNRKLQVDYCYDSYNQCINNSEYYNNFKDYCDKLPDYEHVCISDTPTILYTLINGSVFGIIVYFGPLFVIIPAMWNVQKEVNSNFSKLYLTRKNYKSYIKRMLKEVYKNIWILPTIILYLFICAYMLSGHFDYHFSYDSSYATYEIQYLKNFGVFFICYIMNFLGQSILYINLGLISLRKSKNIIITILEAYLLFIGIEIFLEVFLNNFILYRIFGINLFGFLNILDIYTFSYTIGLIPYLSLSFTIVLLSFIVLKLLYKNKEKTFIEWEK